ncbi:MAG: YidB family protein [Halieaceae bacterium]|jgi:uncharacterized protein YidB (DUF937 family)|nr:YidB family protein [Halieaceae bacterium]
MSLLETAAQLFISKLNEGGGQLNVSTVIEALSGLLPTQAGDLDLQALAGQFMSNGGLASLATSWLSDGENASLSVANVMDILGGDSIANFAGQIGVDQAQAANGLAGMIPELMDQASSGGALNTDMIKDIGGSLLGKLF